MSGWAARRFWREVGLGTESGGFVPLLDGRPLRTPGKAVLRLPSRVLGRAIMAEWEAQGEILNPETMPLTRLANTVIDQLPKTRAAVIEELVAYGMNDLICYRADAPDDLARAQAAAWDAPLGWLERTHGVRLTLTKGVMPVRQLEDSATGFATVLTEMDDFTLLGLAEMTSISGSLVLALATEAGFDAAEAMFERARVDERFQAEIWGADDEALRMTEARREGFVTGLRLIMLARETSA